LHEKEAAFEEVKLDLMKGDQTSPEFLALNPRGLVPALKCNGQVIVDSSVIIEFLDAELSGPSLSPDNALERARMHEWMRLFEQVAAPAIRTLSHHILFRRDYQDMTEQQFMAHANAKPLRREFLLQMGREGFSKLQVEQAKSRIRFVVASIRDALADGRNYLVDEYSLADISIVPIFLRMIDLDMGCLWKEDVAVATWCKACVARPAVRKAGLVWR
jgi:glutathione S-transferase